MTYPQQYPGYQQPAPVAPSQPMGGFVQQPPPGYGQPAPQGYYPPQQPQYAPPQQYAQQAPQYYPPQPEQPPVPTGNLDAFYNQPAVGGGKSLKFDQIGQFHDVVFARDVADSDVQAQMEVVPPGMLSKAKKFKDGTQMYVLVLPLLTMDGQQATHYVKGPEREKLIEAMQRAGCTPDADGHYRPKKGDRGRVTLVSLTPTGFGQPRKDRDWHYVRAEQAGGGMNTAQQFAPQQPAPAPQAPAQQLSQPYGNGMYAPVQDPQQATGPQYPAAHPQQTGYAPPPANWQQGAPQQPMGQFVQPAQEQYATPGAVAPPAAQQQFAAPQGMTSEQAAAFAQLTGQAVQQ